MHSTLTARMGLPLPECAICRKSIAPLTRYVFDSQACRAWHIECVGPRPMSNYAVILQRLRVL